MAHPKEKTPMCLVNELARFSKIQPEYKLLREQGPAHCKVNIVHTARAHITHQQCFLSFYTIASGVAIQNTYFQTPEVVLKRCRSIDFWRVAAFFIFVEWVKLKICFYMEYLAFKASVGMSWFRILNRDNSQATVNDFL